jgi:signal transduction histidine kinase
VGAILIVDDERINRELLHACFAGSDHTLIDADSGEAALEIALQTRPDLVLLDVMMPGLDGYATTARLKALFADELLPVVLLTAVRDHESRLRGLRAGADDFLIKPVEPTELMLRVNNLLALRANEAALVQRTVELVELQRFRDEMSALLVHDLKSPLSVILANVDYVLEDDGDPAADREALLDAKAAGGRALRLLANLADVARAEAGQLALERHRTEVAVLLEPLVRQRARLAESRAIQLDSTIDPGLPINVDRELISRVVENLFDNALRHTPPGGRIAVRGTAHSDAVRIRIGNTGGAIPSDARTRIFEKFAQGHEQAGRMNLGLGLYFCRLAAEAHGGRIWVEATRELPTVFSLELPRAAE